MAYRVSDLTWSHHLFAGTPDKNWPEKEFRNSICRAFPIDTRRRDLSWSHHTYRAWEDKKKPSRVLFTVARTLASQDFGIAGKGVGVGELCGKY